MTMAAEAPRVRSVTAGVFRVGPRRIEGIIGEVRVSFERNAGGVFSLMGGPDNAAALARVAGCMVLTGRQGERLEIRQDTDPNPDFYFLEEGSQRLGLRVIYKLLDQHDAYHGDGLQEVWIYPNGDLFCSVGLRLTDPLAQAAITDACLETRLAPVFSQAAVGTPSPTNVAIGNLAEGRLFPLGDQLPGKFAAFTGESSPPLALYWLKDDGRLKAFFLYRTVSPPTYYRWPALFDQFFTGSPLPVGFKAHDSSRLEIAAAAGKPVARLWWVKEARVETREWVSVGGIFALSTGRDPEELQSRIAAHQRPLQLKTEGGEFAGYDDLEGCYMVRRVNNPVKVVLPPDALARQAAVKVFFLAGKGAVQVKVDGQQALADLVSDGGIVDDPLVPVQVQPHAPASECIVRVPLDPDRERVVTVEESPGLQLAYQAAFQTLDQRRNWVVYSDRCAARGSFEFSVLDGKARHLCAWGNNEEAVAELALFWFKNCGYSPQDYLNQNGDFELIENGPDAVKFCYRGTNFSHRAQSEFWVTIPRTSAVFQMQMKCRLTVLQTWIYARNQFYDVFPHEGVYPEKWWYKKVMYLDRDGCLGIYDNLDRSRNYNVFDEAHDRAFFAMYASDRGNLLTLVRQIRPAGQALHLAVCGNYIDHHLDLELGAPPIPAGKVFEVEYDLALYGDDQTSQDEIAAIGRRALAAGRFVLPEE